MRLTLKVARRGIPRFYKQIVIFLIDSSAPPPPVLRFLYEAFNWNWFPGVDSCTTHRSQGRWISVTLYTCEIAVLIVELGDNAAIAGLYLMGSHVTVCLDSHRIQRSGRK